MNLLKMCMVLLLSQVMAVGIRGEEVASTSYIPTAQDLASALNMTWWRFEIPERISSIEFGIKKGEEYNKIAQTKANNECFGTVKIVYQQEATQYSLVAISEIGKLNMRNQESPAVFTNIHAKPRPLRGNTVFELVKFKNDDTGEWDQSLIVKLLE